MKLKFKYWHLIFVYTAIFTQTKVLSANDVEQLMKLYTKPNAIPYPKENPYTKEKYDLGKKIFFDNRLSSTNSMSCSTCHIPERGWGDGLPLAIGNKNQILKRNTQSIEDLAWGASFHWDGKIATLEEQSIEPFLQSNELNLGIDELVQRINSFDDYKIIFKKAFPQEKINVNNIAKSLATFQRTIVSSASPFDRWISGDKQAISPLAINGFLLFHGKANCAKCHEGWRFTDDGFYDVGIVTKDLGRGAVLQESTLHYMFKTPTLRNVEKSAPYFHNGSQSTLIDVINFYNRGGDVSRPYKDNKIMPLNLSDEEKNNLVEFLKTLSSETNVP